MARVFPFAGVRFNPEVVSDPAQVLCPPYDIITPETKQFCYRKHPFNVVRLEAGDDDQAAQPGARYRQAKALLHRWQRQGVLKTEASPAFYLHHHLFRLGGESKLRRGIFAAVGLGGEDIYPHEETMSQPKEDRLNLLRACRANISPIFALYHEPAGEIGAVLREVEASPPLLDVSDGEEKHRLWVIAHPQAVARLQALFASLPLFIADGHHRYETALNYSAEKGAADEAAARVMMTLVEIHDPGLAILPVHRLVRGIEQQLMAALKEKLMSSFDLIPVPRGELLQPMGKEQSSGVGLVGLGGNWLMHLRSGGRLDLMGLHRRVLEGVLGWGRRPGLELAYTPEAASALARVESGEFQLAFIVNSLPVDSLIDIISRGERLPGKATYFYPKLPTGLVMRLL